MADVKGRNGIKLLSSNNYDFDVVQDRIYAFEVFYDSGATASVTVQQGGDDIQDSAGNVIFQNATLPLTPASDMVITASGVARGFDLRATGHVMRFVTGAVSGDVYLRFREVAHGRS